MKKKRMGLSLLAFVLVLALLAGCSPSTDLSESSSTDYDFSAAYIIQRSDFDLLLEDWRIGTLGGKSVKITSGSMGTGLQYTEQLPQRYVLGATLSFQGVTGAVDATLGLGPEFTETVLALTVYRTAEGTVGFTFSQGGTNLIEVAPQQVKDTKFSVVLDASEGTGVFTLKIKGDQGLSVTERTATVPADVLAKAQFLQFSANQAKVVFEDIAVDVMVYRPGDLLTYAQQAYSDLMQNFATGTAENGFYFDSKICLWEFSMAILPMETMYEITGEEQIKKNFRAQWQDIQESFPYDLTTPHSACNPACDDAAWTAMGLMAVYRMTGDQEALKKSAEMVRNSYEFWKDGTTANGLWYRFGEDKTPEQYNWIKSVYCAGLLISALEYHQVTKGTDLADPALYEDTLALYEWVEANLLREDGLYYCDYIDNPVTGEKHPAGDETPENITYANGSCSALFGNMGMAAIHAKLYTMTGKEEYRTRAVRTANALATTAYNHNSVLLNDRDYWTDGAFMRYFVKDVLALEGVDPQVSKLLRNTSLSIMRYCRTEDGYYHPRWSGGAQPVGGGSSAPVATEIMTSSTTVHAVLAAALAEKLNLIS